MKRCRFAAILTTVLLSLSTGPFFAGEPVPGVGGLRQRFEFHDLVAEFVISPNALNGACPDPSSLPSIV